MIKQLRKLISNIEIITLHSVLNNVLTTSRSSIHKYFSCYSQYLLHISRDSATH